MRAVMWIALFGVAACDATDKNDQATNAQGVARMVAVPDITIVFTSEDHKARIDEVLAGNRPKDFHWSSFNLPTSSLAILKSASGLTIDFTDKDSAARFSQVYMGTCNPALEDFSPCWLYESYQAGEVGFKGTANLRLGTDQAFGGYDLYWEGMTDRFGEPIQFHAHGTTAGISAQLLGAD